MRKNNQNSGLDLRHIDYVLLLTVITLVFLGLIMIYSASSYKAETQFGTSSYFLWRQLARVFLGGVALFIFLKLDYHRLINLAPFILIGSILLLGLVLLKTPWTPEINGARRWIYLPGIQFQVSDLARYALVIFLARALPQSSARFHELKVFIPYALFIIFFCFLIYLEPDLGTAIVVWLIGGTMLFFGGASIKHMLVLGSSSVSLVLFFLYKFSYQSQRLQHYIHNLLYDHQYGWQVMQSLISLAQGGIGGVGFGNSRQKYGFLPEPYKDFIFSIIGEELGLIGSVFMLLLFMILIWRGMRIAQAARDAYGQLLAAGITVSIGAYALINTGIALALLPTSGIPIPFISYGGTSLITHMAAVGILLNISNQKQSPFFLDNWQKFNQKPGRFGYRTEASSQRRRKN